MVRGRSERLILDDKVADCKSEHRNWNLGEETPAPTDMVSNDATEGSP